MSRSNIHYEEKRDELSRQIFDIFMKNGYENTTLSLIVKELKISKGALYHYFTTKEACADAAVTLCSKDCYEKIICKIDDKMPAEANFKNLIHSCSALFKDNEQSMENINTPSNTIFHQKLMTALIKTLSPLYAKIISQGIQEKKFETAFPLETAQMILTLTNFYFDADLFDWKPEEMPSKINAFVDLLTKTLNAKPEFFSFLYNID